MTQRELNVLFDCERMKHPYTGLHEYCRSLGKALLATKVQDSSIGYYLPKQYNGYFGDGCEYLFYKEYHKLFFPNIGSANVWHIAHQGAAVIPPTKKAKRVLTIHDLNFLYEKTDVHKINRELCRCQRSINLCDHIVTISEYTKHDVLHQLNVGHRPITVIHNGCEVKEFPDFDHPNYRPARPFLFSIGTILPKKNFHVLPSLLAGQDYELLIAGRGSQSYHQKIVQEAERHGVADRVRLLGAVSEEEKYWYLKNCEAFLFPSIAEGFGIPAIEAMSFGKPVFLSTATSLPEIGGDYAYYFSDFDSEAMRDTFKKGMEHYAQHKPAEQIIKHAKQFSWEKSAREYWKVYESLL